MSDQHQPDVLRGRGRRNPSLRRAVAEGHVGPLEIVRHRGLKDARGEAKSERRRGQVVLESAAGARVPVAQAAHGIPAWIWWGHLERVMLAFDDLGCGDLL